MVSLLCKVIFLMISATDKKTKQMGEYNSFTVLWTCSPTETVGYGNPNCGAAKVEGQKATQDQSATSLWGFIPGSQICSEIDVPLFPSGFVILTIKHLPINNKRRHRDLKGKLMHQLMLEMDMGLFRIWKVLRCQRQWFLSMEKSSSILWKLWRCNRYTHNKIISFSTVLFHLLWVYFNAREPSKISGGFVVQLGSLLTWHWLCTKALTVKSWITQTWFSLGFFLCKKRAKKKRISHGAQTEIMHAMKYQEKELGIKLSWEHREHTDWHWGHLQMETNAFQDSFLNTQWCKCLFICRVADC